ncbi:MBL fold metallo-hydrolase [Terasakiella brassicae]|uniref:MBL fold metallo-hydrolase n=1 Tax=Terasakiella brassicae TaxID=1634917 RepID=A0A917C8X4_9PROT|nr:MBL fold metallo-hydrolase [Terasakiella brassicae]GGF76391.1 MBL fold metallo-hydrolase [Terasakiella brassicae]
MKSFLLFCGLLLSATTGYALEPQKITDNIYALVGPKEQRSADNLANNATFGVIITDEGVVLVDPGGSWNGARQIDGEIKKISKQPVKYVINSGGQDHRWLGNEYWKSKGAKIIASSTAVEDHKNRENDQLIALERFLGEGMKGTTPSYADQTFDSEFELKIGGEIIKVLHFGQAHTPGDSLVFMPEKEIIFSGDIIYVERILGVGSQSNAKSWISVFENLAALKPKVIVPGHGHVTTLEAATQQTYHYLTNLREKIGEHLENGGNMIDSVNVDQSQFNYLEQFEALAKRNAQQVFSEMEWE